MFNTDVDYLLKIPEFKEYYNSKGYDLMENHNHIRKAIREILKEEIQGEFDGEQSFENLFKSMDTSQKQLNDRLGAMQKQYNIPAHTDTEINQMIKKTEKEKMQRVEDDIENSKEQEEEMKKAYQDYLAMKKAKEEREDTMDQVISLQTQSQAPDSVTNV